MKKRISHVDPNRFFDFQNVTFREGIVSIRCPPMRQSLFTAAIRDVFASIPRVGLAANIFSRMIYE